nr:GNAT family N-acetyltransferase [Hasllibacter sp. MH4015]
MLEGWKALPHVAQWWDKDVLFDQDDLDDPRLALWVVSTDGAPFAYLQAYTVRGWDFDHHFHHLPEGSRGVDQFIGPPDHLGQGHGPGFLRAFTEMLFREGVPMVATDPHPDNTRAIRAYEKAGFRAIGPEMETRWGRVLPMGVQTPGS